MELSLLQHQYLNSTFWWNPLPNTEYYIKGGHFQNHIYVMITNFNKAWACKLHSKQILKDKQLYNKMVEIDDKQLMNLLGNKVQKHSEGGKYELKIEGNRFEFSLKIFMRIYQFSWKFQLQELKCDLGKIIRQSVVQPLMMTLTVAENKCQAMQKELNEKVRKELGDVGLWSNFVKHKKEEMNVNRIGGWSKKLLDQTLEMEEEKEVLQMDMKQEVEEKMNLLSQDAASLLAVIKQESTQTIAKPIKAADKIVEKKQKIVKNIVSRRSSSVQKAKKKHKFL